MNIPTLSGRNIVVTGASSGIGREVARLFSKEGARLLLLARNSVELDRTLAACHDQSNHRIAVTDVRDLDSLRRAFTGWAPPRGISGLVHCAGINAPLSIMETTPDEWEDVISVNLTGTYNVCKALLESLADSGERTLVIISSVQARTSSRSAQYAASKAGQEGLMRSLSRQLGTDGIRVNAVAPGGIETEFADKYWGPGTRQTLTDDTHLGRIGRPGEVAQAALFLTSEASSYITASTLHVNGGLYAN